MVGDLGQSEDRIGGGLFGIVRPESKTTKDMSAPQLMIFADKDSACDPDALFASAPVSGFICFVVSVQ